MPGETNSKMFLGYAPITFVRREGNTVYARLLHPDERPEAARPVTIQEGDQLVFEHGALPITVDMLDTPAVAGRDGYAPVTGTVWRCNISLLTTHSDHHRRRLFELSRKLDVTFFLWSSVMSMLEKQGNESEPVTRLHIGLNAHALTEEMFVPLAQALKIAREFSKNYSLDMPVALEDACEGVVSLRNKIQHTQLNQEDKVLVRGIFLRLLEGREVNLPNGPTVSLKGMVNILKEGRGFVLDIIRNG